MAVVVHFEDNDYNLDIDEIDLSQARVIKRQTGMSLLHWQEAVETADPDALMALYWLMRAQNGTVVDMNKVNFKIVKFGNAVAEAAKTHKENPTKEPTKAQKTPV